MTALALVRRLRLDWPLLGKELLEQAARKQMYVVRVFYALVLFGAFCVYYGRRLSEGTALTLGQGMGPFRFLVTAQLVTIYLFMPPLMAGALAREKERDTLGLLFLTDLTSWELILQKYLGRLIPMLTLLFLSLPLLAVAYSLGGVSTGMLLSSASSLFLTCLWVGAVALECSAHEGTTFQALIRSWGICLGFSLVCTMCPFPLWSSLYGVTRSMPRSVSYVAPVIFNAIAYLILTWLFLLRAKTILETRAFVKGRNPFGHQFKQLDQYWKDLRKLLRAILRKRDPEAHAVAAQVVQKALAETSDVRRFSVGHYLLMRMQIPHVLSFAIILGLIGLIALVADVFINPKSGGAFFVVVAGIWLLALLTVPIQSANAVASERINERMGAILTTPLTGREILDEWLGPVRRWILFLAKPLIVVIVAEAIVKFCTQTPEEDPRWKNLLLYLGMSLLTVWIYPTLALWGCLWIGLCIRNQIRALMTSLLVVAAWCFLPPAISGYLTETGLLPMSWSDSLRFVSPMTVIRTVEIFGRKSEISAVAPDLVSLVFIQLGIAALLMWSLRRFCLNNADRYLGRI